MHFVPPISTTCQCTHGHADWTRLRSRCTHSLLQAGWVAFDLLHATMHVAADKTTCATNCNSRSILLRTEPTPPQQTKAPARARACQHEKTDHTDARAANAHVHCRMRCGRHSTARTSTLVAEPSSSGVGPPMRARAVAPVALQSLHVAGNTHVETCTLQHMQHAPRRMQHATPQSTRQARQ
jgi:hypothetical protein